MLRIPCGHAMLIRELVNDPYCGFIEEGAQ
jgi:hypothetical protein